MIKPGQSVLVVGSGMKTPPTPDAVNMDIFMFPYVDVAADAHRIPFSDNSMDWIICEFMLEHVANPFIVCSEMRRVIKPGGKLYLSYPFIHPYHSFPHDYFRFTENGVHQMLQGMISLESGVLSGPACRWIGASADLVCSLLGARRRIRMLIRFIILALLFPVKFLDLICNRHKETMGEAISLYGLFEKPDK